MKLTNNQSFNTDLNRRSLLKTGLALAGGTFVSTNANALLDNQTHSLEPLVGPATIYPSRRKLGKLEVSGIGLGCQEMGGPLYGAVVSHADMVTLTRRAFDKGVTFFDTAEAYGPFESERVVGEAVASFRNQVVIATKYGWNIDQETGKFIPPGLNSRPEHIKLVVEGMLKRLRTDRIDLLYQHRVDPAIPIEDVAGAVKELIKEGKVLYYGLSEPGPQTVRRAHAVHPLSAIQNEHSLLYRGSEKDIIPLCEELGIGFVCWSPLGTGLLTGAIDPTTKFGQGDFRATSARLISDALKTNMALVKLVQNWGRRKDATAAQISLAWLQAQKPFIVPIPGTTKTRHMLENIGADDVRFTAEELTQFNTELASIHVAGERLPAGILALSGAEAPPKK